MNAYEYHLKTWGGFFSSDVAKENRITVGDYWFSSEKDRADFIDHLDNLGAFDLGCMISLSEGNDTRLRTVAKMVCLYKGVGYQIQHDFGHGYERSSAEYMFYEGNYSCDCNLSLFIRKQHKDAIPELQCGGEIEIQDFEVVRV